MLHYMLRRGGERAGRNGWEAGVKVTCMQFLGENNLLRLPGLFVVMDGLVDATDVVAGCSWLNETLTAGGGGGGSGG